MQPPQVQYVDFRDEARKFKVVYVTNVENVAVVMMVTVFNQIRGIFHDTNSSIIFFLLVSLFLALQAMAQQNTTTQAQNFAAQTVPEIPKTPNDRKLESTLIASRIAIRSEEIGKKGTVNIKESNENSAEDLSEFWPPIYGKKFKITDSAIALFTLALVIFTAKLWCATKDLVKGAESDKKMELRAYVGVSEIRLSTKHLKTKFYQEITQSVAGAVSEDNLFVTVKNFGKTPANRVSYILHWATVDFPGRLPKNFDYTVAADVSDVRPAICRPSLFSGQVSESCVVIQDLTPFRDAVKKSKNVFVYGQIQYTDIYDEIRGTKFCYLYCPSDPIGHDFMPYEENNEAS